MACRAQNVVQVGAGLGDRGQLPQHVSIAQSVPGDAVVAVVWRPGVVAGDPGEGRQHPGRVHSLLAALGVHGDQHVPARRGRVHPGELPGDPEPGLVEVRHLGGEQGRDDRIDCRGDEPGDLPRRHRDHRRGRGAAEHVRQRLAGPVPGQELPVPQVRAHARRPAARTAPARSPRPARPPWCRSPQHGHVTSII